ncbi:MAG: L,D-transpeptidase family protein [Thermodesulfobacteria bacterium]|nr:L,D-transpeptidase family protein [Thermodesulfobacteriota bacterium]
MNFLRVFLLCNLLFLGPSWALERFYWSPHEMVVGKLKWHVVSEGETLLDIARWYNLGYNQIVLANPDVDPWIPPVGKKVLIPSQYVLPEIKNSLVVNLAEMRLYFFRKEGGRNIVYTAPIGVGAEGKLTELGVYSIVRKKKNPTWYVPKSIREEDPTLPPVVPPGPENPLGKYALYLSRGAYAIHGTNKPWGIGRRVSHGCIRMYPEDIEALYPLVPLGTPVFIIYQPYKLGIKGDKVFLQAFPDFEKKISQAWEEVLRLVRKLELESGQKIRLYWMKAKDILKKPNGVPSLVGETRERTR